ncbi:hypothetical protein CCC_01811 [Paramagnetospirillum magnetotacticum MS-1]|uniref:Uncharacterized protein n=1 Tax=Paramagnetospirillum magnetotacticum MS-1 TaxID=272627 RepID=A0A0C2YPF8_PARME|nr:fructose-bisphosphate aldolase [Paramagnetospirillum magnetotacticum]KIL97018.1 hypothetical protein CCC_01811 [Paramagnetospirillum magnetotacticum MS-1]
MTPAVIHCLDQARAVLARSDIDRPVRLQSSFGAAGQHGIGWWLAVTRILAEEFPEHAIEAALDCADSPGLALAALRAGVPLVRASGLAPDMRNKLGDIARQMGARLID